MWDRLSERFSLWGLLTTGTSGPQRDTPAPLCSGSSVAQQLTFFLSCFGFVFFRDRVSLCGPALTLQTSLASNSLRAA